MTTRNDKKLINLAKGGGKKATPVKKEEEVQEKVLTPDEERDLKAKETVKNLLDGAEIDLTSKPKEEDLLEVEQEPKSSEWLQEQVALLASENQNLKDELAVAKNDYQRIFNENQRIKTGEGIQNDAEMKKGVLTVFHEIQSNFLKNPGFTPQGTPNFVIVPAAFLNRLILFFPFLAKEKRF